MDIKKVRDILKRDREVSLHDLALETGESVEDIKYILEDWEDRNRVTTVTELPFCSTGGGAVAVLLYPPAVLLQKKNTGGCSHLLGANFRYFTCYWNNYLKPEIRITTDSGN